jgi:hypothetical protein
MATGEGVRGAAALLAGAELRGGARPEYAVSGVPGAIWDGVWPGSTIAAWVIHWCAQVRGFGARSWPAAVQGGPGSPACRMLAPRGRYGLQHLAQKIRGVGLVLTVPGIGRESGAAGFGGEVRRPGVDWRSRRRALPGSKSMKEISRRILAPRRSSCGACQGLGGGGAAWPWRRDALLRAEAGLSG